MPEKRGFCRETVSRMPEKEKKTEEMYSGSATGDSPN